MTKNQEMELSSTRKLKGMFTLIKIVPLFLFNFKIEPIFRCIGEQAAGFRDAVSGTFEELVLIRHEKDLSEFFSRYQVEESEIKREW